MKIHRSLLLWAVGYGVLIWGEAALIIRWAGDLIFRPDDSLWMAGNFLITAILAFTIGYFFFRWFQTRPAERAASAIVICAIGLIGNTLVLMQPHFFFPDMTREQISWFSAWFAWGYGLGLISGIWPASLPGVPQE